MTQDLVRHLTEIETGISTLSVADISRLLRPYTVGMRNFGYQLSAGIYVYRLRKCSAFFNPAKPMLISDLGHPPATVVQRGRANDHAEPVFYCSLSKEPIYFELPDLSGSSSVVLSIWQTTQDLWFNNIGYTDAVFRTLGANRANPFQVVGDKDKRSTSTIELVPNSMNLSQGRHGDRTREIFGSWFTKTDANDKDKIYKISTAIAQLHLGQIVDQQTEFAGIMYPSVSMSANGDNLAILPHHFELSLRFQKAIHIKIKSKYGAKIEINKENESVSLGPNGEVVWLDRLLKWEIPPQQQLQFIGKEGRDKFGDYDMGTDGIIAHWRAYRPDGTEDEIC